VRRRTPVSVVTIALDATYSLDKNLSGVGVYSRAILFGLAAAHAESSFRFAYRPHRFLRSFTETLPRNVTRRLLWQGSAGPADLFHALNQRADSTRYRRTVSTFHDLFVLTGDYSSAEFRDRFSHQARQAAERSSLIICVSRFTAQQVEQLLKVEPARIRVIHHGTRHPPERRTQQRQPIVLFTGAIQRRKNVQRLVEAFEQAAPPGWQLVLAGSRGFGAESAIARIEASPRRADIQLRGYVPAIVLEELYRRASIFAFPSLDEGFGMPVLDAMARGLPVLTSNCSAMPEVAGDAALLVDPHDTAAIAEGLRKLATDETLRNQLAEKGIARSKEFSWEKAVEETWKAYGELLD